MRTREGEIEEEGREKLREEWEGCLRERERLNKETERYRRGKREWYQNTRAWGKGRVVRGLHERGEGGGEGTREAECRTQEHGEREEAGEGEDCMRKTQ